MRIKFKQAVHIKGKDYSRGVHDVAQDVLASAHFQKLVQANWVEDVDAKSVEPISLHERQQRLAEKILGSPKKAPSQGDHAPPSGSDSTLSPVPESVPEEGMQEEPVEGGVEKEGEMPGLPVEDESKEPSKKQKQKQKR